MRLKRLKLMLAIGLIFILSGRPEAQNCIPTGIGGTYNLSCNQVCSTLVFQVPHIKSTDNYTLVSVPYTPYPYVTPTGSEDFTLYNDDQYSNVITLPFTACFYGMTFPSVVVGSNGLMTFDPANGASGCQNNYVIGSTIPWAGGTICASAS
ncbi:MAG TPA: hypothetical protein VMZ03_04580, partial [Chitinophagaceae bacterium]|nr:hypothetical protein [Chitinophagaceae bacterium]